MISGSPSRCLVLLVVVSLYTHILTPPTRYRTSCIRSRVIPLTPEFVSYIREDGIILADDEPDTKPSYKKKTDGSNEEEEEEEDDDDWEPTNPSPFHPPPDDDEEHSDSDSDSEDRPAKIPPNKRFPVLHNSINSAIKSLGGAVAPKLNWSSPKDATWISRHPNTMKCTSANDIYILLKSSSFISHDLDHAFDGTTSSPASTKSFTPSLVLRTFFNPLPSMEFRCFVKDRNLVAITQRDLNYYDFLKGLKTPIISRIRELFYKMRFTFPDSCWVFDVYIPEAYYADDTESESDGDDEAREERRNERRLARARLIDINPWSPKTDTLLFEWDELLNIQVARPVLGSSSAEGRDKKQKSKVVRIPLRLAAHQGDNTPAVNSENQTAAQAQHQQAEEEEEEDESETSRDEIDNDQSSSDNYSEDEEDEEEEHEPELRIVEHDDPAAYNFSSPQYSAHKLPKEVVDASMAGDGGMREFAQRWARIVAGRER